MKHSEESDNARHGAAVTAAKLLDRFDDDMIAMHQRVVEAAGDYGRALGQAGLEPSVVLGQMLQSISVAFTQRIMPFYRMVPEEDGHDRPA